MSGARDADTGCTHTLCPDGDGSVRCALPRGHDGSHMTRLYEASNRYRWAYVWADVVQLPSGASTRETGECQ